MLQGRNHFVYKQTCFTLTQHSTQPIIYSTTLKYFKLYLMYYEQNKSYGFSIDGNHDLTSACRMANDSNRAPYKNCIMRVVIHNNRPHLCLFAIRDIGEGEELRYDYGDPSAPWRKPLKVGALLYLNIFIT